MCSSDTSSSPSLSCTDLKCWQDCKQSKDSDNYKKKFNNNFLYWTCIFQRIMHFSKNLYNESQKVDSVRKWHQFHHVCTWCQFHRCYHENVLSWTVVTEWSVLLILMNTMVRIFICQYEEYMKQMSQYMS